MTIETKTTIEWKDLNSVEFECGQCHTKTVYQLEKFTEPPFFCNVCEPNNQFLIHGSQDYADLVKLIRTIKRFSQANPEKFVMRFGVSGICREANGRV